MKKLPVLHLLICSLLFSAFKAHGNSGITIELSVPPPSTALADLRGTVTGISRTLAQGDCQGDRISSVFQKSDNLSSQVEELRAYFEKCGHDIANPWDRSAVLPLIKFSAIRYAIAENPHLRTAKITLPSGRIVNGVMGLKPDRKPRPFILVKCGVFCDAKESSNVISALMHLFDESPFHVLVLGNITGAQFEAENSSFAVGGFDEGRQLFKIASFLKEESPFKERISSVQTLGVSLGGHAALYSALYSSQNRLASGQLAIDATMAICPVVNLENSLLRLYNHDLLSHGYSLITFRTLLSFADRLPFLRKALEKINKINPHEFFVLLTDSSLRYYRDWTREKPWDVNPFMGLQVRELEQFWGINNFSLFTGMVAIPTFVVVAENDDIVRDSDNAALIPQSNPLVQVLSIPQGGHCAFSVANGYERWSRLLQEYFVSNDPLWKLRRQTVMVDLKPYLYGKRFIGGFNPPRFSEQVQAEWKVEYKMAEASLTLKHFNGASCLGIMAADADSTNEGQACLGFTRIKVPLDKILGPLNESWPQSTFEAQRLTRLLNTRTTLVDENFENYLRSEKQRPAYLKIEGFR